MEQPVRTFFFFFLDRLSTEKHYCNNPLKALNISTFLLFYFNL